MTNTQQEWRNLRERFSLYPSQAFFLSRLEIELERAVVVRDSFEQALEQLEKLWLVDDKQALIAQIEYQFRKRTGDTSTLNNCTHLYAPLTKSLQELMRATVDRAPGERHRADQAISRLCKILPTELQMKILEPWFLDSRYTRSNAVLRCFKDVEDLDPVSYVLVKRFRETEYFDYLQLIARNTAASSRIVWEEICDYFGAYTVAFRDEDGQYLDTGTKYRALIAAKVMLRSGMEFPDELKTDIPEILSWAIAEIGDPALEGLLIELILRNLENPELMWGVMQGAPRSFMPTAYNLARNEGNVLVAVSDFTRPVKRKLPQRTHLFDL